MKYRLIEDDLYHIAERIKYINPFYCIKYNLNKRIFEVHDNRYKTQSLSFVVGNRLDATALKKAVDTQAKFAKKIFRDIEENNKKIKDKTNEYIIEFAKTKLSNYVDYLDKTHQDDISFDSLDKTKWI